mmetsp:Transcript_6623/g.11709  ORF Transcript_6623/g.11709 Transcript_6623/m.11709 type:complete len:140 (+) Transcript_6623:245-664(+)
MLDSFYIYQLKIRLRDQQMEYVHQCDQFLTENQQLVTSSELYFDKISRLPRSIFNLNYNYTYQGSIDRCFALGNCKGHVRVVVLLICCKDRKCVFGNGSSRCLRSAWYRYGTLQQPQEIKRLDAEFNARQESSVQATCG